MCSIAFQSRRKFVAAAATALSIACLLLVGGCNVIGFVAQAVGGEGAKPALFVLAKRPTVIVVEKFDNPAAAALDAEPLARYITDEFNKQKIAPMIDPDELYAKQSADPDHWRAMTIAAIGHELGAAQVVYVSVITASVDVAEGSEQMRGDGELRVRVVDVPSAATLWPLDETNGYRIVGQTKMHRRDENGHNESTTRSELQRMLADEIARLFYTVQPE